MAVITRITDFIPNTLIVSQEIDDEFNQLVNLLSGVSDDNDTILKYNHATDPVLRVDQLGAGAILGIYQNGAIKSIFDNNGHLYIGEGLTDATPANGLVSATGGSGSNIAGGNLDLAGGKGTGNAVPGLLAARYPLRTASGSTLQALSTSRYPLVSNMFTSAAGQNVTNTTNETTMLDAGSVGSTKSIEAGMARAGALYVIESTIFQLQTTGTPTARLRVKVGGVTVVDTTATAFATAGLNTSGRLRVEVWIVGVGATGSVTATLVLEYADSTTGQGEANMRSFHARGAASGTIDFTAAAALDVTWQWGTASASNALSVGPSEINIVRG